MLIILGGLPGSGKTTVAKEIAKTVGAVYLRVDTVEQALIRSNFVAKEWRGPEGYFVCYALAKENLALGLTVVADTVNPIKITRNDWRQVAKSVGVKSFEIEIVCSDRVEHRRRVEARTPDIEGHQLPMWQNVLESDYQPWENVDLQLDSAILTTDESLQKVIELMQRKS